MSDRRTDDATLVSALRILARDIQSGDGVANGCLLEAAQRLEELVEERRWVPARERLPEPFDVVLTYVCQATVDIIRGAYYHDASNPELHEGMTAEELRGWWHESSSVGSEKLQGCFEPTHWMPLPPGPEGNP